MVAALAVLLAGCVSELAERGGPRSRYDSITPAAYPNIAAVPAGNNGKLLSKDEQARQEASLEAKGAAAVRGAKIPTAADRASAKALRAEGANHASETLRTIENSCRNVTGTPPQGCPK
jgi:hypothetical protein